MSENTITTPATEVTTTEKPYKYLTGHFFKGSLKGQINSLWKTKDNKDRIEEYKKALAAGHCKLGPVTKRQMSRLMEMGVTVPAEYAPVPKARKPREIRLTERQVTRLSTFGIVCPPEMMPIQKKTKATTPAPTNPTHILTHDNVTNPSLIPPTAKIVTA